MHSTCSSSSHFCHQVRLQEGKSISPRHSTSSQASPHLLLHHHHHGTNHHHNHLHRAKPHNPNLFVNSSNLDWQFMSLPFDSTTAVHSPPSRPCSALPFDCQQFLQANEAPTSAFPFPVSSFEPDVFEDPIENSAEGASSNFHLHHHPRSPMEQWGNHLATNIRHLKNWWQNRKRRNSKELISRANAEDKHVRSRFSLTCDEKQARKQLEHLIKFEAKKRSKVRFDCGAPYGSSGRITSSPEVPSNVVYVYDRPSYGMVTTSTSSLAHARHHNCLSATSAQAEVFQQRLAQIKRNLLQETDRLSIPNTCSASAVCSNELISSGQHVYCASRVGARRRTIPKLFQAQQAQVHPIVLQSSTTHQLPLPVEQDKHLALTKARTLSMEAKSAVCHSFLATWPTSSTVISSENDFLPTEAELNAHVSYV